MNQKLATILESMRVAIETPAGSASLVFEQLSAQLDAMSEELVLVMREHAGMADELLRAYEQLGIVFDATRKLPSAKSEHAVVRIFLDSLKVTYQQSRVWHIHQHKSGDLIWVGRNDPAPQPFLAAVNECIESKRVLVRELEPDDDSDVEILCAPVFSGDDLVCVIAISHGSGVRSFESGDMSLVETLMLYLGDVVRNFRLAQELRGLSMDLVRALVSAVDQKDQYTSGHSNRVGFYSRLLGVKLGLKDDDLQMLEWSALLHDVGKIGIRDDVLKKPGKLTKEEFEHIKEHPVRSYEVVRQIPQLKGALAGVRHHHERLDGSGYPDGLAGDEIPLQARIVLVADIFDSLTTTRSYRKAFSWEKALEILHEEAGSVGDPKLVELFDAIIRDEVSRGLKIGDPAPQKVQAPAGDAIVDDPRD